MVQSGGSDPTALPVNTFVFVIFLPSRYIRYVLNSSKTDVFVIIVNYLKAKTSDGKTRSDNVPVVTQLRGTRGYRDFRFAVDERKGERNRRKVRGTPARDEVVVVRSDSTSSAGEVVEQENRFAPDAFGVRVVRVV